MNYIKSLKVKEKIINISGKAILIKKASLLNHYILRELSSKIFHEKDKKESIAAIFEYINIAVGIKNSECLDIEEIHDILNELLDLNENIDHLPWQTVINNKTKNKRYNIDYHGRELALIVEVIASAYGWKEEEIFSLQPEVAACYVQEILLDEWINKQFIYTLSEVAYDKDGKLKPFKKHDWYVELVGPTMYEAKAKIPLKFVPDGVVKDVSKKT